MADAADELFLRTELMRVGTALKAKQAVWETPRNVAILVATAAAGAGASGFKFGRMRSQTLAPIVIQSQSPPAAK